MPVLSPRQSSASSALTGSYRSMFSSSTIDRPYFSSTSYNPRIASERYSTRTYSDSDGRRIFSRSGSITEDGITTRFREEIRDSSVRRDSSTLTSIGEYPRRDSSLSRDSPRLSAVNVLESVAELRNKYSPANYVPACLRDRTNENNISRSKSINDIGLPPIESSIRFKKKVNDGLNNHNNADTNPTNDNNMKPDDNGNPSFADLRKRFEERSVKPLRTQPIEIESIKIADNRFKKQDTKAKKIKRADVIETSTDGAKLDVNEDDGVKVKTTRVNNFASFIPAKDYTKEDSNGDTEQRDEINTDISTSPRLSTTSTNSALSPSSLSTLNSSTTSPSRRSSDRDRNSLYNNSDDAIISTSYEKYNSSTSTSSPVKTQGLNGLKNIGNTCFMNSVIQCLSNTKLLLEYLLNDTYVDDINTTTSSMKGALIKAFVEVIKKLWSQDASDRVVNTTSLKSQIQRFAPRFIGYAQQDAQEFLRYLLEGLHEDVNRVKEKPKPILTEIDEKLSDAEKSAESWNRYLRMDNSKIVDYFVGQLKSTLKCTHCGHCSVTFDPFWDLSLPIPQRAGQVRLAQCLDSFTREETLDGDEKPTCSKCKERRRCTKSFTIQKFPKILVIHLKRFSLAERFRGKLSVTVDFPLEGLDMSHYAADNVTPCRYNLYAVSNHSGTTYSGHYTAYCRHPYIKSWHEYNDSRVSSISPKSIISGEAYVLFYEQEGQKSHL